MGNFRPMLAVPTAKLDKIIADEDFVFMQPKLDGIRCYITKDGMFSRNHKPIISAPHIFEELKDFFEFYKDDVILDGELYNHELKHDFNKIISLARKTKPTEADLQESAGMIQFHCYDMFPVQDPEMDFSDRISWVNMMLPKADCLKRVLTKEVGTFGDDITNNNQDWLDDGYEGSMVRLDAPYEQKRSNTLCKVKTFVDDEYRIVGFVEREINIVNGEKLSEPIMAGMLGKFICEMADGRTFGAPPGKGYDFKKLKEIWDDRSSYIDQLATVEYFELTPAGIPRFPKFKALRNYE